MMATSSVPITGATRLAAILADPVAQARTPELLNAALVARGIDAVLVPMHVATDGLNAVIAGLRAVRNFAGAVVSMPHKQRVVQLLDRCTVEASQVGACNVVRRSVEGELCGTMLDGVGFVNGLRSAGIDPVGRRVFLAGAGGAASGIAFALCSAGIAALTILNRSRTTADELGARLMSTFATLKVSTQSADPAAHDLVVNATSLGMRPDDPLPVDVDRLSSGAVVAEAVLAPEVTPLLALAAARGHRIILGRAMLEAQIELMVDFMFV